MLKSVARLFLRRSGSDSVRVQVSLFVKFSIFYSKHIQYKDIHLPFLNLSFWDRKVVVAIDKL